MAADRAFRVLVATDGSPHAKAAIATTVRFPWPARTHVRGITSRQVRADYRTSILLAALDRSADFVAAGARRALARRWPDAEVTIVDTAPVTGILRESKRFKADVIVLGWRGHGATRRLLTGSVSRGVLRGAGCAVLIVRRRQRQIRRLVIGLDGSANARRAVELVGRMRPPRGGHVTVITAVDPVALPSHALAPRRLRAPVEAEMRRINAARAESAKKNLARAAATLTRAGWRVRTGVSAGAPLRDLLASVDSAGADLLVVGARGISGIPRLLIGSVAEGALNRCPVPVLVAR